MESMIMLSGKIKDDGEMKYSDRNWEVRLNDFKKRFAGMDFIIQIQAVRDGKTLQQIRFYWGVLLPALCDVTGVAKKDDIDIYCRNMYIKRYRDVHGASIGYLPSIKMSDLELDRVDFSKYIENCLHLLYEFGGSIPPQKMTEDWR